MSKQYKSSSIAYWVIGLSTVAVIAIIVFMMFMNSANLSSKTNREIVQMCTTEMATKFHIHPHLEIIINGQKQEIPANIGVKPWCMNAIHTHDNSGKIHVESPVQRDFILDDFFYVWGKAFNKNQILDYKADEDHKIRQTINGSESQDYENTILKDEEEIVISYE